MGHIVPQTARMSKSSSTGCSWGGHLTMHIAVAHPARVSGLVLFETLGAVPDGGSAALLARQAKGHDDPKLMGQLYMTLWPSYSYIHGNVLPPASLRLEKPLPDEPDTMTSVRAHFEMGTLARWLPGLGIPALLIHGEGDPMPMSATPCR